ncbi:MAG: RpiB/LacA/LacB family sugar-phosphate isomerase [Christensenellales bacterium]
MKISVVCDRAGYKLKKEMVEKLKHMGHEVIDHGLYSEDEDMEFPDAAKLLCASITKGDAEKGIMFAGTGVGAAIACNKVPGIRASVVHDVHCAHQAVEHDHVQVMCIGEKIVGSWLASDLIDRFLVTTQGNTDERTLRIIRKLNIMDGSEKE